MKCALYDRMPNEAVINCCTIKYIVVISEPKQCTHITHLHKSSILVSLMPETAELTSHHLEQVAMTPMEVVPDKAEPDEKVLPKLSSSPARYNGASVWKNGGDIRSHKERDSGKLVRTPRDRAE
jgi:hypothetical protein